jgi:hypothetical protein
MLRKEVEEKNFSEKGKLKEYFLPGKVISTKISNGIFSKKKGNSRRLGLEVKMGIDKIVVKIIHNLSHML